MEFKETTLSDLKIKNFLSDLLRGSSKIEKGILEVWIQSNFSRLDTELMYLLNIYSDRNKLNYSFKVELSKYSMSEDGISFIVFKFKKNPPN